MYIFIYFLNLKSISFLKIKNNVKVFIDMNNPIQPIPIYKKFQNVQRNTPQLMYFTHTIKYKYFYKNHIFKFIL